MPVESMQMEGWQMNRLMIKALVYGFTLGALLFAIAPLGLGLSLIEMLKPILVPGVYLARAIPGNTAGTGSILVALLLNGVVFTILFAVILLARKA